MQGHHEGPSQKHAALWNALVAYLMRPKSRTEDDAGYEARMEGHDERDVAAPRVDPLPYQPVRWGNFR
jgi:hypothetical protein